MSTCHEYISSILAAIPVSGATDDQIAEMMATLRRGRGMSTKHDVAALVPAMRATALCAHSNACEKGFWDTPPSTPTLIALMHSELSEALEADRKGNPSSEKIPDFTAVEEELADLVIRVLDMSAAQGLRLGEAILAKMEYNRHRPHKHGGKAY